MVTTSPLSHSWHDQLHDNQRGDILYKSVVETLKWSSDHPSLLSRHIFQALRIKYQVYSLVCWYLFYVAMNVLLFECVIVLALERYILFYMEVQLACFSYGFLVDTGGHFGTSQHLTFIAGVDAPLAMGSGGENRRRWGCPWAQGEKQTRTWRSGYFLSFLFNFLLKIKQWRDLLLLKFFFAL